MIEIVNKNPLQVKTNNFSLAYSLDCGQAFRWQMLEDGSFSGCAFNKYLHISQEGDIVTFHNSNEEDFNLIWNNYFDFDTDYESIREGYKFMQIFIDSIEYAGGIHILKQDPWECLCSFIISQNNNIPRIKGIISRLCENFGEEIYDGVYSFPTAQDIAKLTVDDLAPLRAGFRAKYIIDAATKVTNGEVDFEKIYNSDLQTGEQELIKILGVGKKVAQCVLLFGFHKLDAFPIDVWIKRVLAEYFPDGFPTQNSEYAGVAQQYLFHYVRYLDKEKDKK